MTTATVAQPTATPLPDLLDRIEGIRQFLNAHSVERKEEIAILLNVIVSGVDPIFLGPPGAGKTHIIELFVNHCVTQAKLYTHLLAKDQSVSEILGPKDVMAMKAGREARITDGYLTDANFAYLDEIFKASPPMLNPLLDVYANRVLKVGGHVIDCSQLIAIIASSNELPDREDLQAFRDRLAITKVVEEVKTPEGRKAVSRIQLQKDQHGLDTSNLTPITLDEIKQLQSARKAVEVPDNMIDVMEKVEQMALEAGHPISQRRKGHIWQAVTAQTLLRGGDAVQSDDFMIAEHMLWSKLDHRQSAHAIINEIASEFTRKANLLRESMEPIVGKLEDLKRQLAAAAEDEKVDIMDGGFRLLRELKQMQETGEKLIRDGEADAHNVEAVREVLAEIKKAYDWGMAAVSGADDD